MMPMFSPCPLYLYLVIMEEKPDSWNVIQMFYFATSCLHAFVKILGDGCLNED